ncbi:MAG: hypothetical protein JWP97_754 [Labilithrix sp.]|nr:hypothetical protein [Labilithrix sp.]
MPPPGGKAQRIRDIVDPNQPGHADKVGETQAVSGAIVIAVDTYDETADGKNAGDIFVQDLGATKDTPYAGINLFAPSFSPGNLKVSPGDVLDMTGQYQENTRIPSNPPIVFAPGAVLTQLSQPIATFRYETAVPEPIEVNAADLVDFPKAQRWLGMLIRVKNVTVSAAPYTSGSGRTSIDMATVPGGTTKCEAPFPKAWQMTNALMDLTPLGLKEGVQVKSLTGVLGFFCSVQLAPRSAADVQL